MTFSRRSCSTFDTRLSAKQLHGKKILQRVSVRRFQITTFQCQYSNVPYRYKSHLLFGFFWRRYLLFYRFQMGFRLRNGIIITSYESCVRLNSPFDLATRARVRGYPHALVIVLYSYLCGQESDYIPPSFFQNTYTGSVHIT